MSTTPIAPRADGKRKTLAIVCTMADCREFLSDWLTYHQRIGINRFFLFFDDGDRQAFNYAKTFDGVDCFLPDGALQQARSLLPEYRNRVTRASLKKEVMTRQEFNVRIAALLALREDIQWLLHIDIDELFYLNGHNLENYFLGLVRNGTGAKVFLNYEAIPSAPDGTHPFRSSVQFRKNFLRRNHWVFSRDQRELLEKEASLHSRYFNFYQNGKSAVNLCGNIRVPGVHEMRHPTNKLQLGGFGDPLILHYPCGTYELFRQKYARLGDFDDHWNGRPRAGRFISPLHLKARDVMRQGDEGALKRLFEDNMVVRPEVLQHLEALDMVATISTPSELLHRIPACQLPNPQSLSPPQPSMPATEAKHLSNQILELVPPQEKQGDDENLLGCIDLSMLLPQHCADTQLSFGSKRSAALWVKRRNLGGSRHFELRENKDGFTVTPAVWDIAAQGLRESLLAAMGQPSAGRTRIAVCGLKALVSSLTDAIDEPTEQVRVCDWITSLVQQWSTTSCRVLFLDGPSAPRELVPTVLANRLYGAVDAELEESLLKYIESKQTPDLAEYLDGCYFPKPLMPRFLNFDSLLRRLPLAGDSYADIVLPLIAFLNVSITYSSADVLQQEWVRRLIALQQRLAELGLGANTSGRLILPEHGALIVVLLRNEQAEGLLVCKSTDADIEISKTVIEKYKLVGAWANEEGAREMETEIGTDHDFTVSKAVTILTRRTIGAT